MKFDFCDECAFHQAHIANVCESCDEGDQFDPLFDDEDKQEMALTIGDDADQYPIWHMRQAA